MISLLCALLVGQAVLGQTVLGQLLVPRAEASPLAMDAQNRLHLGASYVPGPSGFGIAGGWESRMTRIIGVDAGGFFSPMALDEALATTDYEVTENYVLRHGVYAVLGLRLPHRQPHGWAWDLYGRGGGGVGWLANTDPSVPSLNDAAFFTSATLAGIGGADLIVRFGDELKFGVKATGKAWMFGVLEEPDFHTEFVLRPQTSVELLYQW